MLLTLFSNYQNSLNHPIDDIDILKWILCFSGFNFSGKDFSPGSALFPPFHISSTSDFNFSCKDFSLGFVSLLSSIAANQFHTSSTRLSITLLTLSSNYLGGFNFNYFILLGELCSVLQLRKIFTFLNRFTGEINVHMDSLP